MFGDLLRTARKTPHPPSVGVSVDSQEGDKKFIFLYPILLAEMGCQTWNFFPDNLLKWCRIIIYQNKTKSMGIFPWQGGQGDPELGNEEISYAGTH